MNLNSWTDISYIIGATWALVIVGEDCLLNKVDNGIISKKT